MNKIILFFNDLPYALWDRIPASVTSTLLLYLVVCSAGFWLLNKNKNALRLSLFSLLAFTFLTAYSKWNIAHQEKIIVYNVPKYQAIDFVNGSNYRFIGDSVLFTEGMLQNFHIKPGRIALQLNNNKVEGTLFQNNYFFYFKDKILLLLDSSIAYKPLLQKINVDIIIISKSPALQMSQLASVFQCGQYIFDASNSLWKIGKWKKDFERLHLPFYSVPEQGAFIIEI